MLSNLSCIVLNKNSNIFDYNIETKRRYRIQTINYLLLINK